MPEDRAQAFLQMIRRSERGRLKVYLGYGPGVGKTYQMLQEAHRLKREGIDIVIGLVETHGRAETAAMVDGLEVVPRRNVEYRKIIVEEMDVDAILARHPEVTLVDELAHTNVPGAKHAKRWEDVIELLDEGINVISAVNVQHLESLNDVVAQTLGVTVRETIPERPATGTGGTMGTTGADDSAGATTSVQQAAAAGYKTFVVGISTSGTSGSTADATLSAMANAGGLPRAGTPTYYPVGSAADLSAAIRTLIGVAAMVVTLVCSSFVDRIFRIPADFLSTARLLFLMVGTAVALGFPVGVFTGILEGLQRFYFVNLTNVISTLLRAALIVFVLHRGYGLLTVALITVALPIMSSLARAVIALRVLPLRFAEKSGDFDKSFQGFNDALAAGRH